MVSKGTRSLFDTCPCSIRLLRIIATLVDLLDLLLFSARRGIALWALI